MLNIVQNLEIIITTKLLHSPNSSHVHLSNAETLSDNNGKTFACPLLSLQLALYLDKAWAPLVMMGHQVVRYAAKSTTGIAWAKRVLTNIYSLSDAVSSEVEQR